MKARFPLLRWLGSPSGITATLLVLMAAFWLGHDFSQFYVNPTAPTYPPDFGKARWIAPAHAQAAGYFRKDLYISEPVRHAWMLVTGPTQFVVYVDNHKIPGSTAAEGKLGVTGYQLPGLPSAQIDLTPFLKSGTNTIAIYVMAASYHDPAAVRVRGGIEYAMRKEEFLSDGSWRASSFAGVLDNLVAWTDPTLDDAHWPAAQVIDYDDHGLVQPLAIPPALFQQPLQAHWICAFSKVPQVGMFSPEIDLPAEARDCWLQLASVGQSRLIINGHPVSDSQEQEIGIGYQRKVVSYWIQPWIRAGKNQITVRLASPLDTPALLAQISYLNSNHEYVHVISNHDWLVQTVTGESQQALDLAPISDPLSNESVPARQSTPGVYLGSERNDRYLWSLVWTGIVATVFVALHWVMSDFLWRRGTLDERRALTLDAILHLPLIFVLLVFALLGADAHAQVVWVNRPGPLWIAVALWILLRVLVVLSLTPLRSMRFRPSIRLPVWQEGNGFALTLGIITIVSFVVRVSGIDLFNLSQDEMFMRYCAQGIWERGFPSVFNNGHLQRLTTYELLPYPIAFSALIFGWSDWSVRIPALIFGTLTTWFLGRMGRELFSPKVGLLTALCYTFLPWDVYFARHCIHPAQDQFFALLCFWSYYRAIKEPGTVDAREFYKACLFFVLSYFTWEGSGLILPAFAFLLIAMQGRRWEWMRQFHIYAGLFVISAVVVIQLCSRFVKFPQYLKVGYGLSDLAPKLMFMDQTDTPGFYLNGVMQEQCHLLLSCALVVGLLFIGRSRPLRYVLLLFGSLLFFYSNLLPVYSARYFYYYQDMLILGGCASLCYAFDAIFALARDHATLLAQRVALWSATAVFAVFLLVTCTFGFQLVSLSSPGLTEVAATRYGLYWEDARDACLYVGEHWQPGDGVTGNFNYSLYHFTGRWVNFTLDENLGQLSLFDPAAEHYGLYQNTYIFVPALHNERDFIKAASQFKRFWFIGYLPLTGTQGSLSGIPNYVVQHSRVVYSGYEVNVYLADGMAPQSGETLPDLGLPASPNLSMINANRAP